ncbi:hypothetical protein D5W64_12670 [Salmonella enterica subsp. enterica serovar Saintpaul]|nr:hypothetical protein [Salmonella enterica subsp. enterica serovar Saintpaul]
MKEQFKATRRQLIESMKALRESRNALKGLKGVSAKWDELTKQMDTTQDKIDSLSLALGYPVKERVVTKRDGKFKSPTINKGSLSCNNEWAKAIIYDGNRTIATGNTTEAQCGNYRTPTKANPSK